MKKVISIIFMALCVSLFSGCGLLNRIPNPMAIIVPSSPDEISMKSLNWNFGGFNGSNAKLTEARIEGLSAKKNDMSYRWASDANEAVKQLNSEAKVIPDLLACLFVKKSDGTWVGGKFEWISISRTTRQFGNILTKPYAGWSLKGVPNPCECAFVIVNPKTKVRTNIIKGTWKR